MSWWRRAQSGTLPTAATGGMSRQYPCPACDFTDTDVEVTWSHIWATHNDRRVSPQHARHRDGERRVA